MVRLTYFKSTGKFYAHGQYRTQAKELYKIWREVEKKLNSGSLPGLMPGHYHEFLVLVNVPSHTHNHPHLIMPPNFVHDDHQCL